MTGYIESTLTKDEEIIAKAHLSLWAMGGNNLRRTAYPSLWGRTNFVITCLFALYFNRTRLYQ